MKKSLLLLVMMLLPMVASAYDAKIDGIYYNFNSTEKTATVTYLYNSSSNSNAYSGEVVIPEKVTYNEVEYSVTSIGYRAFSHCSGLTSLTISNSVTSIGNYAFDGCSGLTSVTIPNSVTSIGSYAFQECTGLTSISIPNSVTSIGNNAFSNCTGLISVTIPNSVTSIGSYAFSNTNLKKTIWLTNTPPTGYSYAKGTVNYVANNQYSSLPNVKVYPFLSSMFEVDGIKYVPVSLSDRTCDAIDCTYDENIKNVKIPQTVIYKGIAMNVLNVMPYVCYGNKNIEIAEVSCEGVLSEYAFNGCSNLKSIKLGDEITSIGNRAFQNCSALQSVNIPDAVTSIGEYAFSGCSSLADVKIGNKVKTLGEYTFHYCAVLPQISIPKSVKIISNNVFNKCKGLKEVIIEDRETELSLGYYSYSTSSPLFADCPLDSVYIGGNITYKTSSSYGYSPFYRNTTLRTVVITDKETEISANEFYGCTNLQNFTIGDGVTTFGDWAFSGCSSLKKLAFGSQLKTIGKEAFSDCVSVESIVSKAITPPTCGTQALDDINKWSCTLTVPKGTLATYQAADQWKEFLFASEGGGDTPSGGNNGTLEKPFTAAEANAFIAKMEAGVESEKDYYIKGKIIAIEDMNQFGTQYGNCTFYISDDGTDSGEKFYVFRTLYLGNVKYSDDSWTKPKAGDEVIICGKLVNYKGNLPETVSNKSYIYSLNGKTEGGGGDEPDTKKCATPTIIIENGKLMFCCETEGVEYVSTICSEDVKTHNTSEISLTTTYHVSVYATKSGYQNSETVTKDIELSIGKKGDVNGDGKVSITDAVNVVNIILNGGDSPSEFPQVKVVPSPKVLGNEDNSSSWWSVHTELIKVEPRETKVINFINYTSGRGAWNNFAIVLNKPDLSEYAVVRADNYGWGQGYEGNSKLKTQTNVKDRDTWLAAMNGAKVTAYITNRGDGTADVKAIMHGTDGVEYVQEYKNINTIEPNNMYFRFTVDNCHLVFD